MKTSTDLQVQKEKKVDPSHIMQIGMGFWGFENSFNRS